MNEDNYEITVGMTADELLAKYPKELWIRNPDVKKDEKYPDCLIVTYHYKECDVRLEYTGSGDPLFPLYCYAVQEVMYHERN